MNRRQFVLNLFGAAAAAAILPRLTPFARPGELDLPMSLGDAAFAPVYDASLEEFRRLFDAGYRDYLGRGYVLDMVSTPGTRVAGSRTFSGRLLAHQFNVGYSEDDAEADRGRYFPLSAGALAVAAAQAGCGEFVPPPLPHSLPYAHICGPVRFCAAYSDCGPAAGKFLFRFDVLCAETPEARLAAARVAERGLKVRIKERLLISRGTQMRLPS